MILERKSIKILNYYFLRTPIPFGSLIPLYKTIKFGKFNCLVHEIKLFFKGSSLYGKGGGFPNDRKSREGVQANTDRLINSPVTYMQKLLNENENNQK